MDSDPTSNQYESTLQSATNISSETAEIMIHSPDLEVAGSRERREGERRLRGYGIEPEKGEEEEGSVSSDSSSDEEEVDEHRLLSASFHHAKAASARAAASSGARVGAAQSGGRMNPAAATGTSTIGVNLSDSWNDDDIDPFTHGPPLTKWDCFKVSLS